MQEFSFITNDLVVSNNRSLKNRDQFGLNLEIERAFFDKVIGLEAYEKGTHFKVIISPIEDVVN